MKIRQWFSSILLSVIPVIMMAATSWFYKQDINNCILWGLGLVYLILIWKFGFFGYFITKYNNISSKSRKITVIILGLAIAIVLMFLLPFKLDDVRRHNIIEKSIKSADCLRVESTNKSNVNSSGNIIWIEGIQLDGKDINLYELPIESGWEFKEDRPYIDNGSLSGVNIPVGRTEKIKVFMRKGPDNGIAKISIGGLETQLDLYSSEFEQRSQINLYDLLGESLVIKSSTLATVVYYVAYGITLLMMSFIVSLWILAFALRERKLKKVNK